MVIGLKSKEKKLEFPAIGQRLIRTAIAVFLCFLIYILRGEKGIPFYSAITAIFCIQPYMENSKSNALQRTFGTFNGAFWGCLILLINTTILTDAPRLLHYTLVSSFIVLVIYTSVVLKHTNIAYISCVVFLSITVIHLADRNPFLFVLDRVMDTMIGILVSLIVNQVSLPKQYCNDILFVSGLDETLLDNSQRMTSYSKVELNRMIHHGMKFTISTERTIASLMDTIKDIHLNLPVIAFNGAVLFDMKKKEFVSKKVIDRKVVERIQNICTQENVCCFTTAVLQDTLLIFYERFYNPVEEEIYTSLRTSLYRNYVNGDIIDEAECVYLMCVDTQEHIARIYHRIKELMESEDIRMVRRMSSDYPGYTYLKIYHKGATKGNMLEELVEMIGVGQTQTYGTIPEQYDVIVKDNDQDLVVKMIKKRYESVKWFCKSKVEV
ncbi:MAG TPA: HAD hydrolase family protein [Lachnospiraceae bacterium]|nr:HAD hydrolase family protein [Lachnospiraceae bacterium]